MAERRLKLPPFIDHFIASLGKVTERVVDDFAERLYTFISNVPAFRDLSDEEKRAVAYALVGDIFASPIPSPLDAALDAVVQDRIRRFLPQMDKYRRMGAKVAEAIPYVELQPNYTLAVLASIREREIPVTEKGKKVELKIV